MMLAQLQWPIQITTAKKKNWQDKTEILVVKYNIIMWACPCPYLAIASFACSYTQRAGQMVASIRWLFSCFAYVSAWPVAQTQLSS